MRYYLFIPALFVLAVLQSSALSWLLPFPVRPDLMLLAVLSWGMIAGAHQALLWGLVGGLMVDLLSGAPLGLTIIALVPVALTALVREYSVLESNILAVLLGAFIGSVLFYLASMIVLQSTGTRVPWGETFLHVLLPAAVVNSALVPVAYIALRSLGERLWPEQLIAVRED